MKQISIIVGLGYGDEGKGATVNSLIENPKDVVVVRFNGGHQVGHTVVYNGIRHPFSNFVSGTLKGAPTYWSEYCTVNPMAVKKEGDVLRERGITPVVFYNANAMVTTPYDIFENLNDSFNKSHGTVGVGFGKTIQRNEDHIHLYVRDLKYPKIRNEKLRLIESYYQYDDKARKGLELINNVMNEFKAACDELVERFHIVDSFRHIEAWDKLIFEGGQGIMLDMDYGFFPHVTRSNTTSKNAMEIIKANGLENRIITTYYVTRAYQTRHGNGYMSNEDLDSSYIKINPDETNGDDGAQGVFRRAMLDFNQLKYAISCDKYHSLPDVKRKLVITCLDHVGERIPIIKDGNLLCLEPRVIGNLLNIFDVFTSNSDEGVLNF